MGDSAVTQPEDGTFDKDREILVFFAFMMTIPISLHSIGLHILYVAGKRTDFHRLHLILLSALSTTSIAINTTGYIKVCIYFFEATVTVQYIFSLVSSTFLYTLYVSLLALIVVDRVMLFHFQLRYTTVWTSRMLKISVLGIITFAFAISVIFCGTFWNNKEDIDRHLGVVYWPIIEYLFIILNLVAVSYIVYCKKNLAATQTSQKSQNENTTIRPSIGGVNFRTLSAALPSNNLQRIQHEDNKRKRVFFLFIISFLVLVFIPDQFFFFRTLDNIENTLTGYFISSILFNAHLSGNSILYLTTSKKLRKIFVRMYWSKVVCLFSFKRSRASSIVEPALSNTGHS